MSNWVCNRGKSTDCFSVLLPLSVSPHSKLASSIEPFDKHLSSPLYLFTWPPLLTHPLSFCLSDPPPFLYIFFSLSWESSPPHRWKRKGAGTRHPRGKHFSIQNKLSRGLRNRPLTGYTVTEEAWRITMELWREHSKVSHL